MHSNLCSSGALAYVKLKKLTVIFQYDRKYYRKYLDNGYMKVNRPQSIGRGDVGLGRSQYAATRISCIVEQRSISAKTSY